MSLSADIKAARSAAFKEAKATSPWVFGRGSWFATLDKRGEQCSPSPGADPIFALKLSELPAIIERVQREYPEVQKIIAEGGYDGAESMEAKKYDDYEPWVSAWSVTVWERP